MTSAFSWAGSFVRAHSEPAAGELERGGADSKFFRSLFLVAVLAGVLFVCKSIPVVLCAGALAAFSLWRYFDRRWKNSQLTYEYFIMLKLEEAERKRVESKL
jgi:hypothetical protein